MKPNYLILLFLIFLYSCNREQNNQRIFNAANLTGERVEKKNFDNGKYSGSFVATAPKAQISFTPENGVWDMSQFVFLDCEVENLSDHTQLVELLLNEDAWAMGGVYFKPGEKKIVRSIIMRQEFTKTQLSQFPNMNGLPGGSIKLWWKSYTPDSIQTISLYFPLSEPGDQIKVGTVSLNGNFETFTDQEYHALIPIVDQFGQYIHKEWPGKIKSQEDLLKVDTNETADLKAHPGHTGMTKYGGWKDGPKLNETGHFRVEKYQGKWSIVDPEGYLFWSHGIDCVRLGSSTPVEGREKLFSYLPDSVSEFKDFISTGRVSSTYTPESTAKINTNAVRFVDFYGMNLQRKWGEDYKTRFVDRTIKRLKSWEINTIANWSSQNVYKQHQIPYTIFASTAENRMLPDPFDPNFGKSIEDQLIQNNGDALNDSWCLGIFVDNEIHWGNEQSLGSIVLTTNRYPFAKETLITYLKTKYKTIAKLNQAWQSKFTVWNELTDNTELFTGATEDIKAMSGLFADEYFRQCKMALKQVAPNKLYLGSRFDFHFYPDLDAHGRNWVIPYAGKYADIVSFNRYNYSCNTMKPSDDMDFPIIIGEFHVGALDRGLPHSGLRQTNNQQERAFVYKNFLTQAIHNPFIVGVGWFQYLDQPYTGRFDGENYQIGFITVGDYPNQELVESARKVGSSMYQIRYNQTQK